jgi:hypothetical protein
VLTLGENANVVVDRYVFNPEQSKGEVALSATRGAFRFAGGKLEQLQTKKITVSTPVAALAVRPLRCPVRDGGPTSPYLGKAGGKQSVETRLDLISINFCVESRPTVGP